MIFPEYLDPGEVTLKQLMRCSTHTFSVRKVGTSSRLSEQLVVIMDKRRRLKKRINEMIQVD
jgi:hypothetical protein